MNQEESLPGPEMAGVPADMSRVTITLMKGVLYRDGSPLLWQFCLRHQSRIRDYVAVIGLDLVVDEAEGYAYLRQRPPEEMASDSEPLPRLIAQRPLGYTVSLLLVLLRKKLAEADARSGEGRLILSQDEIVEMLRLFLPDTANEARQRDKIAGHIGRIAEMGFLRPLPGDGDRYEVGRIIAAYVDAQWLDGVDRALAVYAEESGREVPEEEP
ncbi:MAG: DUF4194 domain-containing protein [Leptospirillia bacterium]